MVLVFAKSPEEQVVALQYFYQELVFIRRSYSPNEINFSEELE
jgi:hypothetical protein